MRYWVAVEGIIGAGKSTILPLLACKLRQKFNIPVVVLPEPVNEWVEDGILQKTHDNAGEWNFIGQTHFFHSRISLILDSLENAPETCIILTERSPIGDRLMWDTQLSTGRVEADKHKYYLQLWIMWQRLLDPLLINAFIYLRPGLQACMDRMEERGREEENNLTESYLNAMQDVHDAHLSKLDNCLTIHSEDDFRENINSLWPEIGEFLESYIKV